MSDDSEQQPPKLSPSEFMRQLRPELYSDTSERSAYQLDAATLGYHLDTITSRNDTHVFEIFCRKLCERTICPNLMPATGPEGGGDSKADSETITVADEIATRWYVGEANAGRQPWAFAFSAKKKWSEKARSDVAGIAATGRGYKRIYFITSRFARARDRARIEDELSREFGFPVRILDKTWIVEQVTAHDRKDLAFHYLGVGREIVDTRRLGPSDYSRTTHLEDIEKSMGDPEAFSGMKMQLATEALVAAKLSRSLERPRVETDGRFARAIRLAEAHGTLGHKLEATYESLWTAFWRFDDVVAALNNGYDAFATVAIGSDFAKHLEMLVNLTQLLFNSIIHAHLTADDSRLIVRVPRLCERLQELSDDTTRPNNALEALTSLLVVRVNQAWIAGNQQELASLWPQISTILQRAKGLIEYDAERLVKMIGVFGGIAGKHDPGYARLVEEVAAFVSERTSEGEGALVLLNRAKQLEFENKAEMIRLLGRAARQLTKREYSDSLIEATQLLALAYRSAGLLWAARASCIFAIATIFIQAERDNDVPVSVIPAIILLAWIAIELRHLPDTLEAIQLLRGCAAGLPLDEASKERVAERLSNFDLVLSSQIVNLGDAELEPISELPDTLGRLGLFHCRRTLLYVMGHEQTLRDDGSILKEDTAERVAEFFSLLASQPAARDLQGPFVLNKTGETQIFVSSVLGMTVSVEHDATETSIQAAEAVVGAIEALFATAFDLQAVAHVESFAIALHEAADATEVTFTVDRERMKARINWPSQLLPGAYGSQDTVWHALTSLAAQVFATTCHARDMSGTIERLFEGEAVLERLSMITTAGNSRQRAFKSGVSRLDDWTKLATTTFQLKPSRPAIARREMPPDQSDATPPRDDHRGVKVRSVIDMHLWDRAGWTGTAFAHWGPAYPPAIALMFKQGESARLIFQRWRERFGEVDEQDEIHLAIVRGIAAANPAHYRLLVTSKVPTEPDPSAPGLMVVARTLTMTPQTDTHLNAFLELYKRFNRYLLVPAVFDGSPQPEFVQKLGILKRKLSVKHAAEIGDHDIEVIAIKVRS